MVRVLTKLRWEISSYSDGIKPAHLNRARDTLDIAKEGDSPVLMLYR